MIDEEVSEQLCCPCGDEAHPPPAVIDAVIAAFPRDCEDILKSLRHHGGMDDFFSFTRKGMFVGVERDGYIHT